MTPDNYTHAICDNCGQSFELTPRRKRCPHCRSKEWHQRTVGEYIADVLGVCPTCGRRFEK